MLRTTGTPPEHQTLEQGIAPPAPAGAMTQAGYSAPFVHLLDEHPPPEPGADTPTIVDSTPSPALLDRLSAGQRTSFLQVWHRLPEHLRAISFDFHGPGWDPEITQQLGDTLIEFADVFSRSSTDFGSCSLLPFEITVPPDCPPVKSRPYRVNPIVSKQMDTILDEYLAAGLIQHSTSPHASPVVIIPKKSGGIRLTINYKKLNKISILGQLPIPRVDEVLDKLGSGRIFSLFDLVSSFHQITVHKDTVPLTAFCTPTRLFEWLVMPQGSSAAPGWFVKVINEVIKDLVNVAAYLDDVIVFDPDPAAHVLNIRAFFKQLRKHNLKLSPSKAKIGATEADFLGHTISPAGIKPNAGKVAALTKMPMPKDLKQLRSLLGGLSYYRKFLEDMAKRIRPITSLLKQGVKFIFTPAMEIIVRELLAELSAPPVLVYPDWDAVADNSRPFLLYCDASVDGFGATLEQEQKDASIRPIVYISRATLDNERHWTPLELEAGSIIWSIKRLRGYLWGTTFRIFSDHKALESFAKVAEHNPRVQRWLEFLTAYRYTLEYRKGSANGNADFLSRLPLPASENDRSGRSRLTPSEEERIYLIRSGGLLLDGPPTLSLGLGGLAPSSHSISLGGLPLPPSDFRDFREHGPRMRIDDLDAPQGEFVARANTSVFSRDASNNFATATRTDGQVAASVFAVPAAPPLAPLGLGQNIFFPEPIQALEPQAPTAPATLASKSIDSLATDIGSQASPAQSQAASRVATANRVSKPVAPRFYRRARLPSLRRN